LQYRYEGPAYPPVRVAWSLGGGLAPIGASDILEIGKSKQSDRAEWPSAVAGEKIKHCKEVLYGVCPYCISGASEAGIGDWIGDWIGLD
jgi:hypothetical protein